MAATAEPWCSSVGVEHRNAAVAAMGSSYRRAAVGGSDGRGRGRA